MKTITEEQAQQLANILGRWIASDENGDVDAYNYEPERDLYHKRWIYDDITNKDSTVDRIPIRIASSRQWTEQIWRPEV